MNYTYKMIQIPPNIAVGDKESGKEAALYLQTTVNNQARDGWEFYRVDPIGVQVNPGCLGLLMGRKQELTTYYVITFRKEAGA